MRFYNLQDTRDTIFRRSYGLRQKEKEQKNLEQRKGAKLCEKLLQTRYSIQASDLRRLINNSLPPDIPPLSVNLFYIAYNIFCSSRNITKLHLLDCNFCKCVSCIDYDYEKDHSKCSICGMCFYIDSTNKNCKAKDSILEITLDDTQYYSSDEDDDSR